MTEYELVDTIIECRSQVVSLLQWWASLSVGIIAGSQLLQDHLNKSLIAALIGFYLFITFATLRLARALTGQLFAGFASLQELEDLTPHSQYIVEQFSSGYISSTQAILSSAVLVAILGTCFYPIWVYINRK